MTLTQILWSFFLLEHLVGIIFGIFLCAWGIHIRFTTVVYQFPVKVSHFQKAFRLFLRGVFLILLGLVGIPFNIFLDYIWKEDSVGQELVT
jgi:uncharacterized membrane protein